MTSKGDKGKNKQGAAATSSTPPATSSSTSSKDPAFVEVKKDLSETFKSNSAGGGSEQSNVDGSPSRSLTPAGMSKQLIVDMRALFAELIIFVDSEKIHRDAITLHSTYTREDVTIDTTLKTLGAEIKTLSDEQDIATEIENFDECSRLEVDLTRLANQVETLIFRKKDLSKTFAESMQDEVGKIVRKKDALANYQRDVSAMRIALKNAFQEAGREAAETERVYFSQSNDSEQKLREIRNERQQCRNICELALSRLAKERLDLNNDKVIIDDDIKVNNDEIESLEARLRVLRQREVELKEKQAKKAMEIATNDENRAKVEATWKENSDKFRDDEDRATNDFARITESYKIKKTTEGNVGLSLTRYQIRVEKAEIAVNNIIEMKLTMRDLLEAFKIAREKELLNLKISHGTDELLKLLEKMKRHKYSKRFDDAKLCKAKIEELAGRLRGNWIDMVPFYPSGKVDLSPAGSISKEGLLKTTAQELSEMRVLMRPGQNDEDEAILATLDKYCNVLDINLTRLSIFLKDDSLIELDIIFLSTDYVQKKTQVEVMQVVEDSSKSIVVETPPPVERRYGVNDDAYEVIIRNGAQTSKKYATERMFEVLQTHLVWFDKVDGKEAVFWSHTTAEFRNYAPSKSVKLDDLVDVQLGAILDSPKKDNRVHNSPPFYSSEDKDKTVTIWYLSDKCTTNPGLHTTNNLPTSPSVKQANVLTGVDFRFTDSGLAALFKQFMTAQVL